MGKLDSFLDSARILIVDDEEPNVRLLDRILRRSGFQHVITTTQSRDALPLFLGSDPDLILLDLQMPGLDGFEVLEQIQPHLSASSYLPILILTADLSPESRQRALTSGAKEFLTKPFDSTEVVLRIRNLLETRSLYVELHTQNELLEQKVQERTRELEKARLEILRRLALAAEFRDDDTGQHTERVGRGCAVLARAAGLGPQEVELIRRAAPLHDVGKIGVPDSILLKPGRLTEDEMQAMQLHTVIGAGILSGSEFPLLQLAERIALHHHERWDGAGYPHGLIGAAIPLPARIVSVVDVFDVLTHHRPYKKARSLPDAVTEMASEAGRQFDPQLVEIFLDAVERGAVEIGARAE